MRKPNRMARFMIIIFLVLFTSVQSNVSESMSEAPRSKRHQEEQGKTESPHPHPEALSKALATRLKTHSTDQVPYLKIFGDVFISLARHLEPAGSGLDVKDCPSDCFCALVSLDNKTALLVQDCKHNPIDSLSKTFDSYRNITHVIFINCHLKRLPPEIMKSPVMVAHLYMNDFTEIPQELLELPLLGELFISNNKLSSLPINITEWSTLTWLDLSHNVLVELPEMSGISDLRALNLSYNEIESLPQGIGAMPQLLYLDASYNKLSTLPAETGNLRELLALVLRNNQIKTLPYEITHLNKLTVIELSNNPLRVVPALPTDTLKQFMCTNCSIQTLPCELFTEGHIQVFQLTFNDIRFLECRKLFNFHLSYLEISYNSLQEIPCDYKLVVIETISFSVNNISAIPKDCNILTGRFMENIYSHHNKIQSLYFSSFCTSDSRNTLRYIGFAYNRISIIDTSDTPLYQCFSHGAVIQLQGNMLSALDAWPMLLVQTHSITLDVSKNNLSEFTNLNGTLIQPSQFASTFVMQKNQIKHFMDIFNGWKVIVNTTEDLNTLLKNIYFDLSFNPLVCDCIDYKVYRYIQGLSRGQYINLLCHEPEHLKWRDPNHIPLLDFVCDVRLDCPDGCTCTEVPHSQTVNVTCLSYNETDIPDVIPSLPKQNYEYRLDICHQNLPKITFRPYLLQATEIRFSNSSVTAININSSVVFERVKILYLDNNLLKRLPESVAGMTNDSAVEIRLGGNPWVCDCDVLKMNKWILRNWHIVKDKDAIICNSPPHLAGIKVMNITRSMVCPEENLTPVYIVAAISSTAFISVVLLYICDQRKFAKWRIVGSDECDGEFKEFDVFMCACADDPDADYVENYLIPEMERRDFRVLYHREHFHGGKPIHVNMAEAIEKSKRTLAFFSNNFRESGYSMFEFHSAHDLDIRNNTRRLVTIMDTDLDMSKLEVSEICYFKTHTYIAREDPKFWKLLEGSLPRKRLGAQVRNE